MITMATTNRPSASSDFFADGRDRSLRRIFARAGVSSRGASWAGEALYEGADWADGWPGITALLNKENKENISGSRLHELHTRIQHRIQQIDHQIDDHEQQSHQHHVGYDDRTIELVDAVDQQLAHAGPGKHGLGNGGVSDQRAELHTDHGDDWNQD